MTTFDQKLEMAASGTPMTSTATPEKILLALSHKKWKWQTLDSLQSATRLEEDDFNSSLKELLDAGLIAGSFIRETRQPIFALAERVGGKSVLSRITGR